jgi:serine/threonine protein kinase
LTLGGVVGSGTFGVVFKAMDDKVPVALKKIKMERETQGFPVTAIREIKILKALRHPNIVDMREIVVYDDAKDRASVGGSTEFVNGDVFMVFEYVDYDLSGILKSSDVDLTPAHIKSFSKQLLEGVHYLHKNKILHRDIKAANILITNTNVLKIADWGLARFYQKGNSRMTNPVVTLWYRSPELLCGSREYGPEVDIWSVGCLFAEMYTRNPIFAVKDSADSLVQQLTQLYQQCGTPRGDLLEKYKNYPDWEKCKFTAQSNNRIRDRFRNNPLWSDKALGLLEKLLDFDPDNRISADTALHDTYFYEDVEVKPEQLPRFDSVETARGMDVAVKQRADYEQAVEAARAAEERKRKEEEALAASIKSEKRQKLRQGQGGVHRRNAGLTTGASKYKVVRPGSSGGTGTNAPSPATVVAAAGSFAPAATAIATATTAPAPAPAAVLPPTAPVVAAAPKKEAAPVPAVPTLVVSSEAKAGGGANNGAPAVVNTISVASISNNDANKGGGW